MKVKTLDWMTTRTDIVEECLYRFFNGGRMAATASRPDTDLSKALQL